MTTSAQAPRVLLAEDNRVMSDVVRFNLERAGYRVNIAATGLKAWDLLDSENYDILLTDYQMPGMNGEQLCRRLRAEGRHADLPIVLISAKGLELDVSALTQELKIQRVMHKPFSPRQVVECVNEILSPAVVARAEA